MHPVLIGRKNILLTAFFLLGSLQLQAADPVVDGFVPASMNVDAGENSIARFILGSTAAYNRDYAPSDLYVGNSYSYNHLTIRKGSIIAGSDIYIGFSSTASHNQLTVTDSQTRVTLRDYLYVGSQGGSNTFVLEGGAYFNSNYSIVGNGATSDNNLAIVRGEGSHWKTNQTLTVGRSGSDNILEISYGGLVSIAGNALTVNQLAGSSDNFIGINQGYLALQGDKTSTLTSLIAAGQIRLSSEGSWINATVDQFNILYLTDDEAGLAFTDDLYDDLGGYTILTAAIPEPASLVGMSALGTLALAFRRRRKR